MRQGDRIEAPGDLRVQQQCLDLGGEVQSIARLRVEERPHPGAIPRKDQTLPRGVPERDRELPVQEVDEAVPMTLVEVHDHLGVRLRVEAVSFGHEAVAQLDVVEYLAIENHPDGAIFVVDRLVAALHVDDAQARMAEAHGAIQMEPRAVRTAMAKHCNHRMQLGAIRARPVHAAQYSGDAAHRSDLPASVGVMGLDDKISVTQARTRHWSGSLAQSALPGQEVLPHAAADMVTARHSR